MADADIKGVFQLMDHRGFGKITLEAIFAFTDTLPVKIPVDDVTEIYRRFDADGSGDIDEDEFCGFIDELEQLVVMTPKQMVDHYSRKAWLRLFELVDADGGGTIGKDELKTLVDLLGGMLSLKRTSTDVMAMLRESGGSELDFEQFFTLMRRLCAGKPITQVVRAFEEAQRRRQSTMRSSVAHFLALSGDPPKGGRAAGDAAAAGERAAADRPHGRARSTSMLARNAPPPPLPQATQAGPAAQAAPATPECADCAVHQRAVQELESLLAAAEADATALRIELVAVKAANAAASTAARAAAASAGGGGGDGDALAATAAWATTARGAGFGATMRGLSGDADAGDADAVPGALPTLANSVEALLWPEDSEGARTGFTPQLLRAFPPATHAANAHAHAEPLCAVARRVLQGEHHELGKEFALAADAAHKAYRQMAAVFDPLLEPLRAAAEAKRQFFALVGGDDAAAAAAAARSDEALALVAAFEKAKATVAAAVDDGAWVLGEVLATRSRMAELAVAGAPFSSKPQRLMQSVLDIAAASSEAAALATAVLYTGGSNPSHVEVLMRRAAAGADARLSPVEASRVQALVSHERAVFGTRAAWDAALQGLRDSVYATQSAAGSFLPQRRHRAAQTLHVDSVEPIAALVGMAQRRQQQLRAEQQRRDGSGSGDDLPSGPGCYGLGLGAPGASGKGGLTDGRNAAAASFVFSSPARVRTPRCEQAATQDAVDRLVRRYLASGVAVPPNFARLPTLEGTRHVFLFGTRRIDVLPHEDALVVPVGGGFLLFDEFCLRSTDSEAARCQIANGAPGRKALAAADFGNAASGAGRAASREPSVGPRASSRSPDARGRSGSGFGGGGGGGYDASLRPPPRGALSARNAATGAMERSPSPNAAAASRTRTTAHFATAHREGSFREGRSERPVSRPIDDLLSATARF